MLKKKVEKTAEVNGDKNEAEFKEFEEDGRDYLTTKQQTRVSGGKNRGYFVKNSGMDWPEE